jgi:hypothetical protein
MYRLFSHVLIPHSYHHRKHYPLYHIIYNRKLQTGHNLPLSERVFLGSTFINLYFRDKAMQTTWTNFSDVSLKTFGLCPLSNKKSMKKLMQLIRTQHFGKWLCSRSQVIKIKLTMEGGPTQLSPLDTANLNPQTAWIGPTVSIYTPQTGLCQKEAN